MYRHYRYTIADPANAAQIRPLLAQIAQDRCAIDHTLKNQPGSTVWLIGFKTRQLVVKRYNNLGFVHACKRAFRRSRAEHCFAISGRFSNAGIRVAAPFAVIQEYWGPIRLRAWYISERIHGEMLRDLGADWNEVTEKPAVPEAVVTAIEALFDKLRKHRLSHGDLKASNILWAQQEVWIIDLDAADSHRRQRTFARAHARDCARFMKNWQHLRQVRKAFAPLFKPRSEQTAIGSAPTPAGDCR